MKYAILFLMLSACTISKDLNDTSKTVQELLVSSSKQLGCLNGVSEVRSFGLSNYKEDLTKEVRYHMVTFCLSLK